MTLRERIKIKKLNRKRKKREKIKREEKRERGEKVKMRRRRKGKLPVYPPTRPPTEKPNVSGYPVAPANYIMIFNGPKGKTWPPKIFGRGVGLDGSESSFRC